ncbi:MAG TPA: hypothetical protein VFO85_18440 [Vicinamibacteria bacterium]|nr:hypothetical protein [Vicinamibacteria bacterium]
MDDLVQIGVYVDALRRAQVLIGYEGRRDSDGALLFTEATNFAFVDRTRGRPVRVPQPLLDAIRMCPGIVRGLGVGSNEA